MGLRSETAIEQCKGLLTLEGSYAPATEPGSCSSVLLFFPFLGLPLPDDDDVDFSDFSFRVIFLRAGLGLEFKECSDSSSTSEMLSRLINSHEVCLAYLY